MHNEQLMGIRREEEMEMSDDDMEDPPDSKDSEDSGMHMCMRVCLQISTTIIVTTKKKPTVSIKQLRGVLQDKWQLVSNFHKELWLKSHDLLKQQKTNGADILPNHIQ